MVERDLRSFPEGGVGTGEERKKSCWLIYLFIIKFVIYFHLFPLLFPAGIQLTTEPELIVEQLQMQWRPIAKHYAAIIALTGVGLLLAIAIPVVGFFVCCCRCAGKLFISSPFFFALVNILQGEHTHA